MYLDWTAQLRAEARAEVAKSRAARGLPAWDWKDPEPPAVENAAGRIAEEVMLTRTKKICACGCGTEFETTVPMPNHSYARGHKPKAAVSTKPAAEPLAIVPKSTPAGTLADAQSSYAVTTGHMRKEVALLEAKIEHADDEMEKLRKGIAVHQAAKDDAVERHGLVMATLEAMGSLCGVRKAQTVDDAVVAKGSDGPAATFYPPRLNDLPGCADCDQLNGFSTCTMNCGRAETLDERKIPESGIRQGLKDEEEFDRMFAGAITVGSKVRHTGLPGKEMTVRSITPNGGVAVCSYVAAGGGVVSDSFSTGGLEVVEG